MEAKDKAAILFWGLLMTMVFVIGYVMERRETREGRTLDQQAGYARGYLDAAARKKIDPRMFPDDVAWGRVAGSRWTR